MIKKARSEQRRTNGHRKQPNGTDFVAYKMVSKRETHYQHLRKRRRAQIRERIAAVAKRGWAPRTRSVCLLAVRLEFFQHDVHFSIG